MEKPMTKRKLPRTDSIQELAKFWDTHDLTDFQDEMEEITEAVFVRETAIPVPLHSGEAEAVRQLAQAKGISQGELIREWVLQKLARRKGGGAARRSS
jgi:predicted DNA binding CopG/RHH family protein